MVSLAECDAPRLDPVGRLHPNLRHPLDRLAMPAAIPIRERVGGIVEAFEINVGGLRVIVGVTPSEIAIVPGADVGCAEDRKT
jgi:hypothetical protein